MRHHLTKCQYLLLAIALLTSCQPYVEPEPIGSQTPIFGAAASINGVEINYPVDGKSYEAEAFQEIDSFSINVFSGTIAPVGCTNDLCGPQFMLEVRGEGNIDNTVLAQPYDIRDIAVTRSTITNYTITLSPSAFGNPESCSWVIDGEEPIVTDGSESLILERTNADASKIQVELTATFAGNCSSTITDWVYLPHHGCDSKITVSQLSAPEHLLFEAKTFDVFNAAYQWEFESGPMSSSEEVEYFFNSIPVDGIETIMLTTRSNNCEVSHTRNQIVSDSIASCNINLDYEIEEHTIQRIDASPDPMTIVLTWIDEGGEIYRSENVSQPEWSYFNLVDVADHTEPILGSEPVSKSVLVECAMLLANDSGETVELREAEFRIPVGNL